MARPPYDGPWPRIRKAILERDGHQCQIRGPRCKVAADTVDHIIPTSQGGEWYDPSNLRAACATCNRARVDGEHGDRWQRAGTRIVLVVGPPGADLLAYVEARRGSADLVVDYGALARSMGGAPHEAVTAARKALLRTLIMGESTAPVAWITSTNPKAEGAYPWHETRGVDPGRAELLAGLRAGGAGPAAIERAENWYEARCQAPPAEYVPSRNW